MKTLNSLIVVLVGLIFIANNSFASNQMKSQRPHPRKVIVVHPRKPKKVVVVAKPGPDVVIVKKRHRRHL